MISIIINVLERIACTIISVCQRLVIQRNVELSLLNGYEYNLHIIVSCFRIV